MIVQTLNLKSYGPTRVIYYRTDDEGETGVNIKIVPIDQSTRESLGGAILAHHCVDEEVYYKMVHKILRKLILMDAEDQKH